MSIKTRLYWFGRNLIAFICMLLAIPFYMLSAICRGIFIVFFVQNGSIDLAFPWEWDWRWDD